ncbi:TPA: hypothetical protein ACUL4Z_000839 [Pseudomonas aeruginosa]|nr:hypothetical protein [Pseudomonas aeruginosa]
MAYYSGGAVDMTAVRAALIAACTAEGWTWDSGNEVLYKAGVYFHMPVVSGFLRLQGRTALTTGAAPELVKIGPFTTSQSGFPVFTWPVAYEVFVFDQEVYLVINYSVDTYQWLAFGKSSVAGLPGTGAWFAGTSHGTSTSHTNGVAISASAGGGLGYFCPGILWASNSLGENYFVHSDLDGGGWSAVISVGSLVGAGALAPLVALLPNSWNSEAVLLPVRAYKYRSSSKTSLTADLVHCRITRNDNLEPGELISLGADRWKVFPCFRKNAADRNSSNTPRIASGTFAMAIRYEGP